MAREMRTVEEIVSKINERLADKYLLFPCISDFVVFLPFEAAAPFLRQEKLKQIEKRWEPLALTDDAIRAVIAAYLPFAWEKANNCRALSAGRSLVHLSNWFWLLGEAELSAEFFGEYTFYGKPHLVKASEFIGFDWRKHDNGARVNKEPD